MHLHIRSGLIVAVAAVSLVSSASAQTAERNPGSNGTTVITTAPVIAAANWMTQEAVGQWRASKMLGLGVYNSLNEKIGSITELIVDQSGKLDAAVVETGGFLGLGERHVAVPFGQMEWSYQPVASSSLGTPPGLGGTASTAGPNSRDAHSYPDHALLNMSKDQLKAAPAFKFSR